MPQWPYPHRVALQAPTAFIGPNVPVTRGGETSAACSNAETLSISTSAVGHSVKNSKLQIHPDRIAFLSGRKSSSVSPDLSKSQSTPKTTSSRNDEIPFLSRSESTSSSVPNSSDAAGEQRSSSDSDAIPFFHSNTSSNDLSAEYVPENPRKRAHREAEAFAGHNIPNDANQIGSLVPYTGDADTNDEPKVR